jgi:hypothetical protein
MGLGNAPGHCSQPVTVFPRSVDHLQRLLQVESDDPRLMGHQRRFLEAVSSCVGAGKDGEDLVFVTAGPHYNGGKLHVTVNLNGRKPQWHVDIMDVTPGGAGVGTGSGRGTRGSGAGSFEWRGRWFVVTEISNADRGAGVERPDAGRMRHPGGHHPTRAVLSSYFK